MDRTWKKIFLFGDSLTQYSFATNGWGAAIADAFQRKADVINRGFSGYNTKNAVDLLQTDFPEGCATGEDAVVVWFGANDSVLKTFEQHIPVEQYASNLCTIVDHFSLLGISKTQTFLISPPTVDPEAWVEYKISQDRDSERDRLNENTKLYAEAAGKVAKDKSCVFIDLWSAFMREENWKSMFCDGLHFNDTGNRFVAKQILEELSSLGEEWKMARPDWKDFYNSS